MGDPIEIEVDASGAVQNLKEKVLEETGISIDLQYLCFEGAELEDEDLPEPPLVTPDAEGHITITTILMEMPEGPPPPPAAPAT